MMMMGRKLRRGLAMALAVAGVTGFPDSVTFTRSRGNATYLNSSGVLTEETADNVERVAYTAAGAPAGIPIEGEARTNLLLRSQEFDNASWTLDGATVSANSATSPEGVANADTLLEAATTATHRVSQTVAVTSGTTYTLSIFPKKLDRRYFVVRTNLIDNGTFNNISIDLDTGVATVHGGSYTATVETTVQGFYRLKITFTATVSASPAVFFGPSPTAPTNSPPTYAGSASSGVILYGAQLEAGATATSYIPTTTAAVTRNAETAYMQTVDGAELVQPAQWALSVTGGSSANSSNSSGVLTLNPDATFTVRFDQAIPTVVGRSYTIACDVATNSVRRAVGTTIGGTDISTSVTLSAGAGQRFTFVATTPLTWVRFWRDSAGAAVVSNISLRNAVPYAGFNNGPDGTRDCWDATRVGVPATYDTVVVAGDRTITATKGATDARAYLNLYTRPGTTYRVIYTGGNSTTSLAPRGAANGATGTNPTASGSTAASQSAYTFVALTGVSSLLWVDASASFTISNLYVEEVSATAPIGAAPHNRAPTSAWAVSAASGASATTTGVTITLQSDGVVQANASIVLTTIPGRAYRLWSSQTVSSGTVPVRIGTSEGSAGLVLTAFSSGAGSVEFTATTTTTHLMYRQITAGATATITGIEVREVGLVSNGDFPSATTGWTGTNATLAVASGELQLTTNGVATPKATETITGLTVGKTYRLTGTARRGTCTGNVRVLMADVAGFPTAVNSGSTTNTTGSVTFTATATTHIVELDVNAIETGTTAFFDNIVVEEVTEQGQGALVVEFSLPAINTSRNSHVINLTDGTASNTISLYVNTAGVIIAETATGGSILGSLNFGAYVAGQTCRVALTWGYDMATSKRVFRGARDGGTLSSTNPALLPQPSRLDLMNRPDGTRAANGYLRYLGPLRSSQNDNWPPLASVVAA